MKTENKLKKIWFNMIKEYLNEEEAEVYFCVSCGEPKEFLCEYETITTSGMDRYGSVEEEGDDHSNDESYKCRSCFRSVVQFSPQTIIEIIYNHVGKDWTWSKKKLNDKDKNPEIKKYITAVSI